MTPLGLHHLMAARSSLRPGAVGRRRAARGLDVRVLSSRRRARHRLRSQRERQQCRRAVRAHRWLREFGDLKRVPEEFLLWFHHVPWDYRTQSGRTLWDELVHRYTRGVDAVREMRTGLGRARAARRSRAPCAGRRVPADPGAGSHVVARRVHRVLPDLLAATAAGGLSRRREHSLDYYKALEFPYAPGN